MRHETQLVKHYGSIHSRLMNPKNAIKTTKPREIDNYEFEGTTKTEVSALKSKLFETEKQIKAKQELIDKLVLDLSDAHARILSQASQISALDTESAVSETKSPRKPVMQIIEEILADYPDVSWEEVKGVRRTRHLIGPRQRLMYEIYKQRPDLSFPSIGRIFGGRDHTTVLHAVHKVRAQKEEEQA